MLFNSQIFIFIFLPLVLIVYYGLHKLGMHTLAKVSLIAASFIFYGYNHPVYLLILIFSILFNFMIYKILSRASKMCQVFCEDLTCSVGPSTQSNSNGPMFKKGRRLILIAALLVNLGIIFYFKYFDFFIENSNRFLHTDWVTRNILLPLGISFFTFQQVSFVVDSYRGEAKDYDFTDYCLFVSFFPQLVAGPIVLHSQLIPQFRDESRFKFNVDRFGEGVRYFVIGLFKKTMMADAWGRVSDLGYRFETHWDTPSAALIILAYTLQIYLDFSGYSDMAIGLGKMLGFELPVNFDMPYKATDIGMFWKRWHMTMTGFFTKYVYIPLGGSRKGKVRTYINTLIVFAVSGLWHGAGWSFVEWGLLHGIAVCFHRAFGKRLKRVPKVITGLITFVFVNFAWVFFRSEGTYQAGMIFTYLLKGGVTDTFSLLTQAFAGNNLSLLLKNIPGFDAFIPMYNQVCMIIMMIVTLIMVWIFPSSHDISVKKDIRGWEGPVFALMAVLSIMTFTNVNTFIYFNF
ncbi:MAG: MBOAT family protein [Lachnospiraceae bacterium]|nr:MBOAT family protein [Lachnospiraceae bacterium]